MAHANAGGHLQVPNVQGLAQTWNGSGASTVRQNGGVRRRRRRRLRAPGRRPRQAVRPAVVGRGARKPRLCLPAGFLSAHLQWGCGRADPGREEGHSRVLQAAARGQDGARAAAGRPRGVRPRLRLLRDPEAGLVGHALPHAPPRRVARHAVLARPASVFQVATHDVRRPAAGGPLRFSDLLTTMLGANLICVYRESGYVCRSSVDRFSAEAAKVVSCLLRFMAEDMGVEPERLLELFGGQPQTMKVTYYPPCRQAGQVIGLSPHTDACAMTLLLHVNDVQGLQIRRDDGKWLAVEPLDGALTVFVGDVIEILSNGKYRSVEHRAVVHPDKERITAAMFHQPLNSIMVEPLPELVKKDDGGARYKSVGYAEFMRHFFSSKLDGRKGHLDHFRIY